MDEQTTKDLVKETSRLLEDETTDWSVIEALWRPYVDQGDTEAEFRLADAYLDYCFDEGPEKDREMRALLRIAADKNHPDATYRIRNSYMVGQRSGSPETPWLEPLGPVSSKKPGFSQIKRWHLSNHTNAQNNSGTE